MRGNAQQAKVHFKGKDDDFIVFVESPSEYKKWLGDRSIALTQVVNAFKIFVTHKQGAQGNLDEASKSTMDNEFGSHNEDECIIKILENGTLQLSESSERSSSTNDAKGSLSTHHG